MEQETIKPETKIVKSDTKDMKNVNAAKDDNKMKDINVSAKVVEKKPSAKKTAARTSVEVTVSGETLRLTGVESEEYILGVVRYLDDKTNELLRAKKTMPVNSHFMKILLPLNIADDFFKEKEKTKNLEEELDKYMLELGKLQQENFMLQKTINSLQLELDKARIELAQFIDNFGK